MRHARKAVLLLCLLLATTTSTHAVDAPPIVLLWPNGAPGSEGKTDVERTNSAPTMPIQVTSVHKPSLTVYLPAKETGTGAGVIVIPGGGHRMLVMEHEGYTVGRWLSERGIAAFILKYRLAREQGSTYQVETHALADTQRAIRLVRSRAKEWDVDPARVGVLGFSAGGELAALASVRESGPIADAADPIDREGARPDFQALLYPAIPKDMTPTKDTPPAFMACGFSDRQNISEGLPSLYLLFKQAGVPTDLHVYAGAGHGFGIREGDKSPAGGWPARFREWLDDRGFLGKK